MVIGLERSPLPNPSADRIIAPIPNRPTAPPVIIIHMAIVASSWEVVIAALHRSRRHVEASVQSSFEMLPRTPRDSGIESAGAARSSELTQRDHVALDTKEPADGIC